MFKKILMIFTLFTFFMTNVLGYEKIVKNLRNGGNVVFIRHAIAPGGGDPNNFNLNDCRTQRNLSSECIKQSKEIGNFFIKNKIPVDKVYTSEWCRCKDTAKYAFKIYRTFSGLNSFFSEKFKKNKKKQLDDLLNLISKWDGKDNLVLVTHYVVIFEVLGKAVSSGEIVVTDKNLKIIDSITTY